MESRPWLGRPEVDCLHLTASQRRRRKKALKEAEKAPTSPVAAPSPESALADTVDQAKPGAEVTPLAVLVAAVECMAAARLLAPFALRRALVALIDSGLSDRTLYDGETLVTSALNAVYEHRSYVVVYSAELRVAAAHSRAMANLDTGYAARTSPDVQFAALVALMRTNPAVLSVQTDGLFALADNLSLSAEHTRVGARAGAFEVVDIALRARGAALVSAAGPALNRMLLSAATFLSARHVTELDDFAAAVHAIGLVLAHSRDASAVDQALEVLSSYCNGTANLLFSSFENGVVGMASFTDLVQVYVEALDRWVLNPEFTRTRDSHLAVGVGLLGAMFQRSPECKALGLRVGAARTLAAVHAILEQRTDISDGMKASALHALQYLDPEESAKLQSSLPSAGAGRRSQPQHRSKAPLSASELAVATAAADVAAAELLAADLLRQLEALQSEKNALERKTAALEREKNEMEREKNALQLKTAAMESALESQICSVCLDAPRSHVLFSCHHHCLCGSLECFRMLGTPPLCPICRSAVAETRQNY